MELRHLRYFVAAAEAENVTQAAQRLHVSQPALSRQIRDLECELGAKLFERRANAVRLSETGKSFLLDCRQILRRVDDAVGKIKRGKQERVRVGYAASPTAEILARALKRFHDSHPYSKVILHDMTSRELVNGIRENEIDVALTVGVSRSDFAGLTAEEIGAYEVRVTFAKGHRFEKLRKVPLADIASEPQVTWTKDDHPEAHLVLQKILSPCVGSPNISMECDSAQSLTAAVESGKGVALVFRTLAKVAGKRIIFKSITPAPPQLPIAVVFRKESLSAVSEDFVAAVRAAKNTPKLSKNKILYV